nr:major facilitator transporter [Mycolicibacterium komanii]
MSSATDVSTEPASPVTDSTADASRVRTALVASLVGTTIEWYDFFLYATAASLVFNQAFFPIRALS